MFLLHKRIRIDSFSQFFFSVFFVWFINFFAFGRTILIHIYNSVKMDLNVRKRKEMCCWNWINLISCFHCYETLCGI